MKKVWIILLALFVSGATAWADEETVALSQQARESVQLRTQEMGALGVPEAQAKKMLTQMVQNRFQKQNQIRAQQVVMEAAKTGLPTEPVMNKAMEGMAKQAKEQQVVQAMETVRSRYAHAHRMAQALTEVEETVDTLTHSMADSMAAGMKTEDMQAVAEQVRTRQQTRTRNKAEHDQLAVQTMEAVRTMARRGLVSEDVSEALCQALQNRYTHREMKQLQKQVASMNQLGTAQQIANQHAHAIGRDGEAGNSGGSGSGSGGSGSGSGGSGSGSGGSGSGSGGSGSGGGGSGSGGGGGGRS